MPLLAVSAIGTDRPGIVARVTGVLAEAGCNLEDTSMTILRGEFAMMLVVDAPASADAAGLEAQLAEAAKELDLRIAVRPLAPGADAGNTGDTDGDERDWTVVVYGADRPGIVHRVSSALAEHGVNIVDLTTRLSDDGVYAMVMEVVLHDPADADAVRGAVAEVAAELGVESSVHASDTTIL